MECEICGREAKLFLCVVEGNELWLCKKCAKFGVKKENKQVSKKQVLYLPKKPLENEEVSLLRKDYGRIIREARQKKNLTIAELAKKIFEKESYLRRIENQQTEPEERIIKKLESFLGIKLRE